MHALVCVHSSPSVLESKCLPDSVVVSILFICRSATTPYIVAVNGLPPNSMSGAQDPRGCGTCLLVTGPSGSTVVTVVDRKTDREFPVRRARCIILHQIPRMVLFRILGSWLVQEIYHGAYLNLLQYFVRMKFDLFC